MATRAELLEAIERLNEKQMGQVMALVQGLLEKDPDPIRECLKTIPGVKLPAHWPQRFKRVEPLKVEGELVSERLIRERR